MRPCLSFAYIISKDELKSAGEGSVGSMQAGGDLISAPNSEIRQASEKFQAYLVNAWVYGKIEMITSWAGMGSPQRSNAASPTRGIIS